MASFDFVESASKGYQFVWNDRRILARLAFWPLLIKLASFTLITYLDMQDQTLRQGLILIPSSFAEGWLVAMAIRMAALGEPWSGPATGDARRDAGAHAARKRAVTGAMLIYVLTKLILAFFSGLLMDSGVIANSADFGGPMISAFFAGVLLMLGIIWAFRFTWLYVPAALGFSVRDFLRKIKPFMVSVYMMGLWFLCLVPMALALIMMAQFLATIFPVQGDTVSPLYLYGLAGVQAVLELAVALIAGSAMGYAVLGVMRGDSKRTELF